MRVLVRDAHTGKEYWDTESKVNVFVPTGQQPGFEVAVNPQSMLSAGIDYEMGIDIGKDKDKDFTAVNGKVIDTDNETDDVDLESMTIKELRQHAEDNEIELPATLKTKKDIITEIGNAGNEVL